jgi:hypothetical protein
MNTWVSSGQDQPNGEEDQRAWNAAVGGGAVDSWMAVYTQVAGDCVKAANLQPSGSWVTSGVIRFQTADQAKTAWTSGLFLGAPPSSIAAQVEGTLGQQTGLGEASLTTNAPVPEPGTGEEGVVYWAKGNTLAIIASGTVLQALTVAKQVDTRM